MPRDPGQPSPAQVSVLREYREQVPHEFDFTRELRLLDAISGSLEKAGIDKVVVPHVLREFCGQKIITMHFLKVRATRGLHPLRSKAILRRCPQQGSVTRKDPHRCKGPHRCPC